MCDKGQEVNLQRLIKRARNKTSSHAIPYSNRQTAIHRAVSFLADVSCRRIILVEAGRGRQLIELRQNSIQKEATMPKTTLRAIETLVPLLGVGR
jgi:hypothetical protein